MTRELRVLIVEDVEDDATLILRELKRLGFAPSFVRVEDAPGLRGALAAGGFDVVLSDWSMPSFSGLAALAIVRELGLDIPFLIISGTIGEETAVQALHAGASDFLVKGRLARLGAAIDRELREKASRLARQKAEEALRLSERRFQRLAESGIVGVVVSDDAGRILEANDAVLAMVGVSREQLLAEGLSWSEIAPADRRITDVSELRATGVAPPRRAEWKRRDGGELPVLVGSAALEEPLRISFAIDLSEQRRAEEALRRSEEQLLQVQKMEAIGSLAGGVAHDFNNMMFVVGSYSDLIAQELQEGDPLLPSVLEIKAAAERATELTRQLLAFSRKQMLKPTVVNLKLVAHGIENMLRRLMGEHIELSVIGDEPLSSVLVDKGQIEQVIVNLCANARDAMPDGGKLTLEVSNVVLDEAYASEHLGVQAGPHVMLAVTDTGMGIDKATQARMFEPFFTTKEQGRGTGLGLSTVFGIVRQSGGTIWVYSELGEGTTFKLYFPRAEPAASEPVAVAERPEESELRGTETILLVEDEQSVRQLVLTLLERKGYRVLEARNGGEALLLCEQHQGSIQLMLTDVVMPRMSGPELAERLASVRPEMKVLFMSGYADRSIVHHGVLDAEVAFLQKPVSPERLLREVRKILDEQG